MSKKPILLYKDHLLYSSETFIKFQGEGLTQFKPYYVGSRLQNGIKLPQDRTLVVNDGSYVGKLKELAFKAWGYSPDLIRSISELDPCLLHAHFGVGGALALPLARRFQIPLMVTFHGFDATVKDEYARNSFLGHRIYLRRRTELKQSATLFLAVSEYIKEKMLEQGYDESKILVHYTGIDIEFFRPSPLANREPIVLFVGRLVEKKGCEYLIRAMQIVQDNVADARLVVIGDGPLRSELEELSRNILKSYEFLGSEDVETVRLWMNKSKVFCVPSVTAKSGDSEGFGMVFAEAQAMELPVVSFCHGGITEAVSSEKTGFLVTEGNWKELGQKILVLFNQPELWRQFGVEGRKRVSRKFDLHKQTCLLEDIYTETIAHKSYE
jgi:glycosyltransferase involved in cell wall biosynthesis